MCFLWQTAVYRIMANKMIQVTFCAYDNPDSVGGPLTWLRQLLPALREYEIESRCLFLTHWGATGPCLEALRSDGFVCHQAACHDHTYDRIKWVLSQLRDNPPDIFVPNLVVAGYFAARWIREAGIPTVGILHSDDAFYRGLQDEFVFGRQQFRLSALACVSQELEKQVIEKKPESTEVYRIPYGVSVQKQKDQRVPGKLRLAYVGRLAEEQKRISDLTRALCRVTQQLPDTDAVLYGDGPDRANVENILETEGAGLPIHLAGRIDNDQMQSRLLDCDVLVLLSDYEGLPIAVLEAMACGVVPVCLRMRSGIPELVQDGVTGLVVDDREESFVNAIKRLQHEPGLLERLAKAARRKIEAEYSDQVCVRRWAELFHRLHKENRGRKHEIRVPDKLRLPPIRPSLASEDPRPSGLSMRLQLYRRGSMFAGKIKRRLLGQPIA